jgi:hypothetical protein
MVWWWKEREIEKVSSLWFILALSLKEHCCSGEVLPGAEEQND